MQICCQAYVASKNIFTFASKYGDLNEDETPYRRPVAIKNVSILIGYDEIQR